MGLVYLIYPILPYAVRIMPGWLL